MSVLNILMNKWLYGDKNNLYQRNCQLFPLSLHKFTFALHSMSNDLEVVVYGGVVREKPSSKEEARQFLKDYSGRHAATVGSVLVTNLKTGLRKGEWDRVEIYFNEIPDETIEKLVDEGITLNVAGGLIIEHPLILPFVKEVVGTTDSVMGLPKALTEKLLKEAM
ncbi:hypothetical protein Lal_00003069 [Lupinus albus]|nr:hypothetical protein Lal_00003069 [Lupinus albus]